MSDQSVQYQPSAVIGSTTNAGSVPFVETGYASTVFLLLSSALVFIMTPGVGLLYSGLARSKNALSLVMLSYLSLGVITIQWILFGFSLSFSEKTHSFFSGNFGFGGFTEMGSSALLVAPAVPSIVYALYQMQFATVTASIIFGSVAERIRILPALVFIFLWTTVVYDYAAYWTWAWNGWARNMACIGAETPCGVGSYDYAGGGPVHLASGCAGLAYCLIVGKRRRIGHQEFKPHNMNNVFLGTALLWFGWFGFNGGSAVAGTARAAMAGLVTTVAASAGGLTWTLIEYSRTKKMSGLAFCCGALAGLVSITPGSGFVAPWAAIVMGAIGAVACAYGVLIKDYLGFDDSLDAWGLHAVGGFVGNILTGIFAQKWVAQLDGTAIDGGWIEGNFKQVGYQLAGSLAIAVWSFVVSFILLTDINMIPGLSLRVSPEAEDAGCDYSEMGEVAYESVPTSIPLMNAAATEASSDNIKYDIVPAKIGTTASTTTLKEKDAVVVVV